MAGPHNLARPCRHGHCGGLRAGEGSAVDVTDNSNGTYALAFTPARAGAFELLVCLEGQGRPGSRWAAVALSPWHLGKPRLHGRVACTAQVVVRSRNLERVPLVHRFVVPAGGRAQRKRSFAGLCRAGPPAAQRCSASPEDAGAPVLAAARPGRLRLARADAAGNALLPGGGAKPPPPFALAATGPGQVRGSFRELAGGAAELLYSATRAGTYMLTLRCGGDDASAVVPGTPLSVEVVPGGASPAHCQAQLDTSRPAGLHTAGEPVSVAVALFDRFGNPGAELAEGQRVEVCAAGPERQVALGAGEGEYTLLLRSAGSYVVSAAVGGQLLPGWPQQVHVQPAGADASRCWLSGSALQVPFRQLSTYRGIP